MRRFEAAVILAGGRSRRMGAEKSLVDIGGETFLARQLRRLEASFEALAVSVAHGGPSAELAAALSCASRTLGRPVVQIRDELDGQGPLAGVAAALAALPVRRAFFVAVDAPEIDLDLVAALWTASLAAGATGAVPRWARGLEPAFAVYGCSVLGPVRSLLAAGERSLQALAGITGVRVLDLEVPGACQRIFAGRAVQLEDLFSPVNTPEELALLRRRTSRAPGPHAPGGLE